jgi:site-specific DNA-methyltransferase (adenine-specific)
MKSQVLQGNNVLVLKTFPDCHFDSIVTDPPYGIAFLGKDWDSRKASETTSKIAQLHNLPSGMKHTSLADDLEFQYWMRDVFAECLRVLKPGGHLLAFSAARTYHHMAMAAQTAGFEIRDQIMWIYSSGFPKSQDVGKSIERTEGKRKKLPSDNGSAIVGMGTQCSKCGKKENGSNQYKCSEDPCPLQEVLRPADNEWAGWGTQLKPAHEPIVLARKPIKLSIAGNCQKYGVGALHIDATRVPFADENDQPGGGENGWSRVGFSEQPVEKYRDQKKKKSDVEIYLNNKRGPMERARIQDGENIGMFDGGVGYKAIKRAVSAEEDLPEGGRFPSNVLGEIAEPYQKYFYCPKVSRAERHIGHELPAAMFGDVAGAYGPDGNRMAVGLDARTGNVGNNHPTVKPIELMKYLIKLITPAGGRVLDPFNGSGSTGCAAVELDYDYTGIELDAAYVAIAERRIAAWYQHTHPLQASGFFE